ncbi:MULTISPECIES: Uma2 family endonuclease [Gordonia]|jgi:Uma2 family endonuclease|uniref:Uma2 family endonuclease n=1 Tax=Gordonia TaxID=2053 RepID=UPI003019D421
MTLASRHNELMSLEQWRALGEDTSVRSELQEGVLIVSPSPTPRYQRAIMRLGVHLHGALPDNYDAIPEVDVVLDAAFPPTVRRPDLVVTRPVSGPVVARDVVVIVEVLSPGTRRVDLVLKRYEYAEAGIPNYWIVDLEGTPRLEALTLVDGRYVGDWVTGTYTSDVPFPVTVDLDSLV